MISSILAVRSFEIFFSLASVSIHCVLIRKLLLKSSFHPCLRQSLIAFQVSALVLALSLIGNAVVATSRGVNERGLPPSDATLSPIEYVQAILTLIASLADYTLWLAQNFLLIDITISTVFLESYDERFRGWRTRISHFLLFVLIDILQIGFSMFHDYFLIILIASHGILNGIMSFLLLRANRKADKIGLGLRIRFQVKENIKCSQLYPLIVSSVLLFSNIFGEQLLWKMCRRKKEKKEENTRPDGEIYWEMLASQWERI